MSNMLVIKRLSRHYGFWQPEEYQGITVAICDDARARLMPTYNPKQSYELRIYKKKPRGRTVPFLISGKCWKEDKPSARWKRLGTFFDVLQSHFDIKSGDRSIRRFHARVIESKASVETVCA
jgi:hypothetical protein